MKHRYIILFLVVVFGFSGCQNKNSACPPPTGTPQYLSVPPDQLPQPSISGPTEIKIGLQSVRMDKVIQGPLCNGSWSGTVYVGCDVLVYPWNEEPTFLKDCQLNIEPETVVYVAYHNNAAYYNGCSCHTGATPTP